MRVERADVDRYAEVFHLAERAGWEIEDLTDGEGGYFAIMLRRNGETWGYGSWRGNINEFRRFCAVTKPAK